MYSDEDRQALLRLARETLRARLTRTPLPPLPTGSEALQEPRGAFVTLRNRGRLRGCIGTFTSDRSLAETVREMAAAVLRDPRFMWHPVTTYELPEIAIEISVISPLKPMADPLAELELGTDGISIESMQGQGCFLPQVAAETGWSKEEFLVHCCTDKACLPADAWKSDGVTVYKFQAEVFGEEEA